MTLSTATAEILCCRLAGAIFNVTLLPEGTLIDAGVSVFTETVPELPAAAPVWL